MDKWNWKSYLGLEEETRTFLFFDVVQMGAGLQSPNETSWATGR